MAINKSLYGWQWQKYRANYLRLNPLCVECQKLGKLTPSAVVDHIQKHNNDITLFWASDNHQALCKHCHDSYKQTLEKSGYTKGSDINGMPLDESHHWNK
jgi:5-methylcytosine-specific restriction protein A